jgi:hypothetical protein
MNNPTTSMKQIAEAFTFSERIEKEAVAVIIRTGPDFILGYAHIRPSIRFIDTLMNAEKFLAITHAVVYDNLGKVLFRTNFLSLNRDEITYIIPRNEMPDQEEKTDFQD